MLEYNVSDWLFKEFKWCIFKDKKPVKGVLNIYLMSVYGVVHIVMLKDSDWSCI